MKNFEINGIRERIQLDLLCIRVLERILQKIKVRKDASQAEDLKWRLRFVTKGPGQRLINNIVS